MLAALTFFADTLTLATEAAEEEPSKTLFYVLGLVAAGWAILLFAVGMRSERFPSSDGAYRGVLAVSFLVVVGAMASAVITA
jgi:drug/metabolite transporter (DMT)-like permease